ncbi:hypothetical protein [Dolosigranulum pigrum]|uniref:hypothetical protein n=1 Tax=Dolosigranulum pigrum TaxID=29394 RepID=UPI000DC5A4B4|nr:hypothetical protein [Dolosigranulum pigrum]RAN51222.1 hypothetical protein B8A31_08180 [Dolosigranulum pigrum]
MYTQFKQGLFSLMVSYAAMMFYYLPSADNPLFDTLHLTLIVGLFIHGCYRLYHDGSSNSDMTKPLVQVGLFTVVFNLALPTIRDMFNTTIMFIGGYLLAILILKYVENRLYRIDRHN